MAVPFLGSSCSPCDPILSKRTRSDLFVLSMAASSPVASETGTVGSFSLIGTDLDAGDDYMVLSTQVTEAAPGRGYDRG